MNTIQQLLELGLYEDEAKVYLACLSLGGGYVSALAKRAGVHRVTCYHTLDNLVKKGLLEVTTHHNTKIYKPLDPDSLVKKQAEKLLNAKRLLPELKALLPHQPFKPSVRFVEGKEGIKNIFDETLNTAEEIVGYTNVDKLVQLFPEYLYYYAEERQKRKIRSRHLSPYTNLAKTFLSTYYPSDTGREIAQILYVDPHEFEFEDEVYIYGNHVATLSLDKNELMGVVIESPTIAKTHRGIFNLSWLGATTFMAQ
jgi:sugar-specific transcriptional regulator TrmB